MCVLMQKDRLDEINMYYDNDASLFVKSVFRICNTINLYFAYGITLCECNNKNKVIVIIN